MLRQQLVVLGSHSLCARFLLDAVAVAWPAPWLLTASVEALGPLPAGAVETHAAIASARRSDCGTSTCGAPTSAGPGLLPGLLPLLRAGASAPGGSASPLYPRVAMQGQLHCSLWPANGWAEVSARSDSLSSANEQNFVCRSEHLYLKMARALSSNVSKMYLQRSGNSFANESMFICRVHVLHLQTYLTTVRSQ